MSLVTTAIDIQHPIVYRSSVLDIYVIPSRSRARDRAFDFFAAERRGILGALASAQPDVIHAHWTYEFGLASRASDAPSLLTVHDWAPAIALLNRHPYWYFRAAMQIWCLTRRGLTTAPSAYVAKRVSKHFHRSCVVVGNGFDLARYSGVRRLEPERINVGMLNVGYSTRKNVKTAIEGWPTVRAIWPGAKLHLAGPDYQLGGPAWAFARDNELLDGIAFEGPIESQDVPAWLHSMNLFLHTSLEESFGMVIGEAMASGTPVVAGIDSGAVAEITKGAAVLTDIRSAEAVSKAVIDTLRDPALLESMMVKGFLAAESFSLDSVADEYLVLLASCSQA